MGRKNFLTIESKLSPDVRMQVGRVTWDRLDPMIRTLLLEGLETVARIRQNITATAKVNVLPPVSIKCESWGYELPDGPRFLNGRIFPMQTKTGETQIGVELPANTIVRDDHGFIRRVLVHEFLHCFDQIIRLVRQERAGVLFAVDEFDPKRREDDDERLADAKDWFSDGDATELLHSDEYNDLGDENVAKVLGALRTREPDPHMEIHGLSYPDDVHEIVERILAREK